MDGNGTTDSGNGSACRELIVYACPTGELAVGLKDYFAVTMHHCGSNTAHEYMPHCTLTGFFHDRVGAIPLYVEAIEQALAAEGVNKPEQAIAISGLRLESEFHYLAIQSAWLESVTATFAEFAESSTRVDALRLKTNLHVSLAYGFSSEQEGGLREIADGLDWQAPVGWDVRLYERHSRLDRPISRSRQKDLEQRWTCHGCWEV
ncbi:MAG: hypothetical protein AB4050_02780 [Synechococcus sp.]